MPAASLHALLARSIDYAGMFPPWSLGLEPKTENAAAFCDRLTEIEAAIRSLAAHNVDLVSVNQLEMWVPQDVDLPVLNEARSILGDLPAFWEAPVERAQETITLLAELNSEMDEPTFGFKLRTGG